MYNRKLIMILGLLIVIILTICFVMVAHAQTTIQRRRIGSVPEAIETFRLILLDLERQSMQDVNDQLTYLGNLPVGHISILLDSGERMDKATLITNNEADRAETQMFIDLLEAMGQ